MNRVQGTKPLTLVREAQPDVTVDEALAFADLTRDLAKGLAKRPALDIDAVLDLKGED